MFYHLTDDEVTKLSEGFAVLQRMAEVRTASTDEQARPQTGGFDGVAFEESKTWGEFCSDNRDDELQDQVHKEFVKAYRRMYQAGDPDPDRKERECQEWLDANRPLQS